MEFTAKQIAEFLNGTVDGNENAAVHTFAKIEEGAEGALSFLSNVKYTHYLYTTKSSVVLVNRDFVAEQPVSATLVRVDNALRIHETGPHGYQLACIGLGQGQDRQERLYRTFCSGR